MFRQRLLSKAEETGADVIIQNEAYTSQTCSGCGNLQRIGGSKIYRCRRCELVMDRDVNGAPCGHCLMEPCRSNERA